ncbi:MAG: small, acid-soluble spore protein, alpha/beta type [Lachnospiraceae bacterium]|nr:small, acid-soluble spore protein, alpha/beta type [Lachnospiraceae bacterium]
MGKNEEVLNMLTEEDKAKYEIAEELGLLDKVRAGGWKSLTAKESGKIGGIIASRKSKKGKNKNNEKVVDK